MQGNLIKEGAFEYFANEKQESNEILSMTEEKLEQCLIQKCNYSSLLASSYQTFPKKIYKEYIDKLKTREIDKFHRNLDNLFQMLPETSELIAYPNRTEYESHGKLFLKSIDPSNSKTPLRIKFVPDVFDFGVRYLYVNK